MIDFYRKSALSQLGKDAGNQTVSEYVRNISSKYDKYLSKMKEEKLKGPRVKPEDNGLYL